MEFLSSSLLELITQTSTNLPPDVRGESPSRTPAGEAVAMASQVLSESGSPDAATTTPPAAPNQPGPHRT